MGGGWRLDGGCMDGWMDEVIVSEPNHTEL